MYSFGEPHPERQILTHSKFLFVTHVGGGSTIEALEN
jgi:hypothetical protein